MADIAVENYKKAVTRAMDRWAAKVQAATDKIDKINAELKKLEANKAPSDDDKKKIAALRAGRDKLKKDIENSKTELKLDLMLLDVPQKGKADEKELIKLPGWIAEIIKKKGVSFGGVTVKPDVDIDFKTGKLKKFELTFKYEF